MQGLIKYVKYWKNKHELSGDYSRLNRKTAFH